MAGLVAKEDVQWDAERLRYLPDVDERHVALAAFHSAHIGTARFPRKG